VTKSKRSGYAESATRLEHKPYWEIDAEAKATAQQMLNKRLEAIDSKLSLLEQRIERLETDGEGSCEPTS
jgi:hypothetical protein